MDESLCELQHVGRWIEVEANELLSICTRRNFERFCTTSLQSLLGHAGLLAIVGKLGYGRFEAISAINCGYPQELVVAAQNGGHIGSRQLLQKWLYTRRALFYNNKTNEPIATDLEQREIAAFNLRSIAIHGVVELSGLTGSYFSFSGFEPSANKIILHKLELVVPYLHHALMRIWRTECMEIRNRITASELQLLQLVSAGHTNARIAEVRNISICTIRNQLHVLMTKLNVSTRLELSARAAVLCLLDQQNGTSVP